MNPEHDGNDDILEHALHCAILDVASDVAGLLPKAAAEHVVQLQHQGNISDPCQQPPTFYFQTVEAFILVASLRHSVCY